MIETQVDIRPKISLDPSHGESTVNLSAPDLLTQYNLLLKAQGFEVAIAYVRGRLGCADCDINMRTHSKPIIGGEVLMQKGPVNAESALYAGCDSFGQVDSTNYPMGKITMMVDENRRGRQNPLSPGCAKNTNVVDLYQASRARS